MNATACWPGCLRSYARISPLLPFGIIVLVAGCASGPKAPKVSLFPEYVLTDPSEERQAKSNVTITVSALGPSRTYEHPELFAFQKQDLPEPLAGPNFDTYYKKDYEGRYWCYALGCAEDNLAAFQVEITNGTDHILRMKDSRVYLEMDGDEPQPAIGEVGDPTLVPATDPLTPIAPKSALEGDESLVHWVTYYERETERKRPKQTILDSYHRIPIGLASQVIRRNQRAYRLVSDAATEILPGRTLKGILVFPVVVSADTGTLSFYDIHTKTDAAGNPVEKQTFTFPVRLDRVQMQWDGEQEKRWKRVGVASGAAG